MDLYGNALLDYLEGNYSEDLYSETSISDSDIFPLPYLFRDYKEMPKLEKKALDMAKGTCLDIGCGSGSHSLYLQSKGFDITALDYSKGACKVAESRGIHQVICGDIWKIDTKNSFDTLYLLMNGAGMAGTLEGTLPFLIHLKSLLKPGGQILLDSSDIKYMFEEEDGGYWVNLNQKYYGEVEFKMTYKGKESEPFDWVYIDFENLEKIAHQAGLVAEKVLDGPHYDYLAILRAPTKS